MAHVLPDDCAGFKYRDVLYCRSCLPPEVYEEARTWIPGGSHPYRHKEGQFFPRSEMAGTGHACDLCSCELEHQGGES